MKKSTLLLIIAIIGAFFVTAVLAIPIGGGGGTYYPLNDTDDVVPPDVEEPDVELHTEETLWFIPSILLIGLGASIFFFISMRKKR